MTFRHLKAKTSNCKLYCTISVCNILKPISLLIVILSDVLIFAVPSSKYSEEKHEKLFASVVK